MTRNRLHPARRHGRGFTLVEALVALLCLSIGLLGIAALQMRGLRNNVSAAWRSQATYLAYDVIDRIRANRGNRALYAINWGAPPVGSTVETRDLNAWKTNLQNTLPSGDGRVVINGAGNNVVTVTIRFDDSKGELAALEFVTSTRL